MDDFLIVSVVVVTALIVVRWRLDGVLVAIPFGWGAIFLINLSFRQETWEDVEFAQDWPFSGFVIMTLWSFLIYGTASLCSWSVKAWKRRYS